MLRLAALFTLAFSLIGLAIAQTMRPDGSIVGVSSQIDFEVKETTAQIMARAPVFAPRKEDELIEVLNHFSKYDVRPQNPDSPAVSQWPPAPQNFLAETLKHQRGGSASRGRGGPYLPQSVGTSWLACQLTEVTLNPPDTQIAVGPSQVLMILNGRIRLFDKAGNLGMLDTTTDNFFASVRGANYVGDPRIRYDSMASRWVMTIITVAFPNRIIICYSDGPTITNSTVWTMTYFVQDAVGTTPNADTGFIADYATLGVDEDGIIIGANMGSSNIVSCSLFVLSKSDVYDGAPYTVTPFRQISIRFQNGMFTPQPVSNNEVGITTSYVIGVDTEMYGRLIMRRLTNVDTNAPILGPDVPITTPTTYGPQDFPVLGSTNPPDALDFRLIEAEMRLNRIDGTRSLWTCHQFEVNAAGVADSEGNRNGTRWYQLNNLDSNPPNLVQAGTLWDPSAVNPNHFWMSGVNMNGQGHMAIMPTAAGATRRLEIVSAGRLRTDPLGSTQAPTNVVTTTFDYPNVGRWGDYAAVRVDPKDDQTMWAAQEYCSANNIWGIRIVKLMAPPPAMPISCSPSWIPEGIPTVVVVTCDTTNGELFDTQPGLNRMNANIGPGGVTINSLLFNSVNQITLTVTASPTSSGLKTITVTNPDGQSVTSGPILNVIVGSPIPALTSITPVATIAGSNSFTLNAIGSNFTANSVVRWNGSNRPTTFVNSTTLSATISAADVATATTVPVTVFTPAPGGGTSAAQTFTVTNPLPALSSISPSTGIMGGSSFTLTCNGTGFNAQSVVRWNGSDRPTTFVNATTLTASISAADIANIGTASVTIFNAAPGGGTSGSQTFTIIYPSPTLTSISPPSASVGGASFNVTCTGTNFTPVSKVRWNGVDLVTTYVSTTSLVGAVPAANLLTAGLYPVSVFTPSPGGGTTGSINLIVNNPVPTISSISPPTQAAGGSGFTLTVTGTNFNSQSIVRFNGANRATTFVNSTTLSASILASDIASGGIYPIRVFNPAPGGGTSGAVNLTVTNPIPVLTSISPNSVGVWGPNFTITCTGSSFVPTSVVRINGSDRATTFVNSNQITATILNTDISVAGPAAIQVFNPAPGGGISATALELTVLPRVLAGNINLIGYVDPTGVPITLKFRAAGDPPGAEVLTTTVNLDSTGSFLIETNLTPTFYDVYADGSIWLQRRLANVNLTGLNVSDLDWSLPAGDIDGDGAITPSDYGIWAINNGSFVTPGEFGDLDGDGAVTPSDYGIWAENNGLFDDE